MNITKAEACIMKISKKAQNRFYYIKKLISKDYRLAKNYIAKLDKNFFMNEYYNLTSENIYDMIDCNKNITSVKNELFEEYNNDYAKAWFENFLFVLESDINV